MVELLPLKVYSFNLTYYLGDGLYKLEASDRIPIVHSVHLYVIVFRNRYCLNHLTECSYSDLVNHSSLMLRYVRVE